MRGMQFLVQSNIPISRPDDFFAEMLKSDTHMANIKSRILRQQVKIESFEEKKHRTESKKFHKAIKDHKMKAKHQEKRDNLQQIQKLKKRVSERGDDMDDKDFDRIMGKGKQGPRKKGSVINTVKEKFQQRQKQKGKFKGGKGGKERKGGDRTNRKGKDGGMRKEEKK